MRASLTAQALAEGFGTYILPGRINDPSRGIAEACEAERLGLGSVWISERFALKEPSVLSGAISQSTERIRINATFYATMRHPLVLASIGNLMQALSGDRFGVILARALPEMLKSMGSPPLTMPRLADFMNVVRRLWAGETVSHDGLLGSFHGIRLADRYEGTPPPFILTATGPKMLEFAGMHCDGVSLHPFLTPEGVARSAALVRKGAARARRDPAAVKIQPNVVVAPDLSTAEVDKLVVARAMTYLDSSIGEILVELNGWDKAQLNRLRAHPILARFDRAAGLSTAQAFTTDELIEVGRSIPPDWIAQGAAVGSARECAQRLLAFVNAGGEEIVLHGASPFQMHGLIDALRSELAVRISPTRSSDPSGS